MLKGIQALDSFVSTDPFPELEEVKKTMKAIAKANPKHQEELLSKIDEQVSTKNPDREFWTPDILTSIDGIAAETFGNCSNNIGLSEDDFLTQLPQYTKLVIQLLKKNKHGHPMLNKVIARFKW